MCQKLVFPINAHSPLLPSLKILILLRLAVYSVKISPSRISLKVGQAVQWDRNRGGGTSRVFFLLQGTDETLSSFLQHRREPSCEQRIRMRTKACAQKGWVKTGKILVPQGSISKLLSIHRTLSMTLWLTEANTPLRSHCLLDFQFMNLLECA